MIIFQRGSKEEQHLKDSNAVESLYARIEEISSLKNNVLIDDRIGLTIGKRFLDAKRKRVSLHNSTR
jgi:hypothetical protein